MKPMRSHQYVLADGGLPIREQGFQFLLWYVMHKRHVLFIQNNQFVMQAPTGPGLERAT
jgi:hypothetical protein